MIKTGGSKNIDLKHMKDKKTFRDEKKKIENEFIKQHLHQKKENA